MVLRRRHLLVRKLVGLAALCCCCGASSVSQDQHRVTAFGAERRARWSLKGKTSLVTGGTKGKGTALVRGGHLCFENLTGSDRSTAVSAQAFSMADTSTPAPAPAKGMGSLAILFVLWYAFNAYYNVSNKMVVRTWFFPYTCAFLQTAIGLIYLIPMWTTGMQKVPKLTKDDIIKLLPIALLHAGGHLAAVLSMSAGAVSFTHIIKASEPVASTAIGPFFGVEMQPMTVNLFLLPIVGGVAFAAMKPGQGLDMSQLTNLASAYAMTSNVSFAIRGILSKKVMTADYKETKHMDASNTYAVLTIMSAILLMFPAMFMEGMLAKGSFDDIEDKATLLKTLLGCGLTYYLYNEMGFRVLERLDPVSSAVGNTVKRVVIMAAAVMFLGEEMNNNKLIGACVAVAGTLAYSLAKNSAAVAKKAKTA